MIPYLRPLDPFPPVDSAREDMGGLLAVGGSLAPERILDAYCRGIFPWGTVERTTAVVQPRSAHGALSPRVPAHPLAGQNRTLR